MDEVNAKQFYLLSLWHCSCQCDVTISARGKEMAAAFLRVYSFPAHCTYDNARRDINLPGRLDLVKFVSSSCPIPARLVVS